MKEIIAMHGWAGDSYQWSPWIDLFECCGWKWQTAERGYKNLIPYMPKWIYNMNNNKLKRIAICHSFGSHIIDKKILYSATHVVLINSFSRFIPQSKESRYVTMALNTMISDINTSNEPSMLRKFHIKAHRPNDLNLKSIESNLFQISSEGRSKLKHDLILLKESNGLPTGLNTCSKVLVINSEKDFILTNQTKLKLVRDLTDHLDKEPTIINLQDEGHTISKINSVKKIKHWLEFEHAKNLV